MAARLATMGLEMDDLINTLYDIAYTPVEVKEEIRRLQELELQNAAAQLAEDEDDV